MGDARLAELTEGDRDALDEARLLSRASCDPRGDAGWPHLGPQLLVTEARLRLRLRDDPGDVGSAALLREVRRYLGRHT